MSQQQHAPHTHDFLAPGSLSTPGLIGRTFRLVMGLGSLWLVFLALTRGSVELVGPEAPDAGWLVAAAGAVWVTSDVVNIGWSRRWGRRPLSVVGALVGLGLTLDLVVHGAVFAAPLGWILIAWFTYVYAHLGVSFLLSVFLATPGCEMRAIPQLVGRLTGRAVDEHACPGPVDAVDRWEARLVAVRTQR